MSDDATTHPAPPTLDYQTPGTPRPRPRGGPPMGNAATVALTSGVLFFATPLPTLLALIFGIAGIARTKRRTRDRLAATIGLLPGLVVVLLWSWADVWINEFHQASQRVACMGSLREVGEYLRSYQAKYDAYPDGLESLVAAMPKVVPFLVCPASGQTPAAGPTMQAVLDALAQPGHVSYVYVGVKYASTKPV